MDYIFGEGGNDVIRGGLGGPDVFYHTAVTDGHDVVVDFEARSDVLVLFGTSYGSYQGALAGAYFDGANLVFNTGNGSSMTLLNTTASAFTPDTLFIV